MTSSQINDSHLGPEVIARGVLVVDGRLLVCRNLERGYLYLPGGHVGPGEPASEAVVREFMEEAGLAVKTGDCALVTEVIFGDPGKTMSRGAGKGHGGHEINLVFPVEHDPEEDLDGVQSQEPHIGIEWLDLAALVDTDLRPRSIRAWLVGGGSVPGEPAGFISDREP